MSVLAQLLGVLMVVAGGVWLVGPWALVAGGLVLMVIPELVAGRTREREGVRR